MRTHVKLSIVLVGVHSAAEALLEALPLVHHDHAERGLGGRSLPGLLHALVLGRPGVRHAATREVQALALDQELQRNAHMELLESLVA